MENALNFNAVNNRKTRALRAHVKRRSHERLGINLYRKDQDAIVSLIVSGMTEFVEKQSNRKSAYRVSYGGKDMIVVYDRSRRSLVTVLPADNSFRSRKDVKYTERFPEANAGEIHLDNSIERVEQDVQCANCGTPTNFINFNRVPVCCDRCMEAICLK